MTPTTSASVPARKSRSGHTWMLITVAAFLICLLSSLALGIGWNKASEENEQLSSQLHTAQAQIDEQQSKYEHWSEDEQQQATAVASGSVAAYLNQPGLSLTTWRKALAEYGNENFASWAEKADPSFRPRGHVLDISSSNFSAEKSTLLVETTGGNYEVSIVREGDEVLVDSMTSQGAG